jgi:hypothetical protein
MDGIYVYLIVALGAAACVILPFFMLLFMKRTGQVELDHYGKDRGSGPAKSFVCPACLHRTYAASHVAERWCTRCNKNHPEKIKISHSEAPGSP